MIMEYKQSEPRSLVIGRFQYVHDGHEALIRTLLDEGKKVRVEVRSMPLDENNPYEYWQVWNMFYKRFKEEMENRDLVVARTDNIVEVVHGRDVGWKVRKINLDPETEAISATKIRNAK